MTFYNVNLPNYLSSGSTATPTSLVDVARGPAGDEKRRSRRSRILYQFDIGQNIRKHSQMYELVQLFHLMNGRQHSFAIKNELDHKSCDPDSDVAVSDAAIGTGDGVTAQFQLRKQYSMTLNDGSTIITAHRNVYVIVRNTLLVAVASVLKTETTHYIVDYDNGTITFTAGNIPSAGQAITAGFQFLVKVRFANNDLTQAMEEWNSGSTPSIPLVEVDA